MRRRFRKGGDTRDGYKIRTWFGPRKTNYEKVVCCDEKNPHHLLLRELNREALESNGTPTHSRGWCDENCIRSD